MEKLCQIRSDADGSTTLTPAAAPRPQKGRGGEGKVAPPPPGRRRQYAVPPPPPPPPAQMGHGLHLSRPRARAMQGDDERPPAPASGRRLQQQSSIRICGQRA